MAKKYKRVSITNNAFLERFSLVNWYTPFLVWIPVIIFLFIRNMNSYQHSTNIYILILISGVLLWTLTEYLMHRFLFHFNSSSKIGDRIVYIMHGNHHEDPADPLRGVMPILPATFYISILYLLFSLFIPIQYLDALFASFLVGYLLYDGIHFYTHHGNPKNKVGKYLRKMHLIHHVQEGTMFGISSPLWDLVFRTYYRKETEKKLATEANLK